MPVGVVYAGNNAMFRSEVFPQQTLTGRRTMLIRGGSDDGGVRPVLHLQAVFTVRCIQELYLLKPINSPAAMSAYSCPCNTVLCTGELPCF